MGARLPLKRFWFGRRSWLEVERRHVDVLLPAYFGRQPWRLEVEGMVVADRAWEPDHDGPVFDQLPIVPFFTTTGQFGQPNTTLLFEAPRRLPPMRLGATYGTDAPFSARATRADEGVLVDGIELNLEDPTAGVATLVAAGVEAPPDPVAWLAARRRLVTGSRGESLAARRRRGTGLVTVAFVVVLVSLFALRVVVTASDGSWWIAPAVVAAVAFAVGAVGARLARR